MIDRDAAVVSTPSAPARGSGSGGLDRTARPVGIADPLYGTMRVAGWAAALLATPPFRRLAGVSLSDVPGELLFGRPFPSRLDHSLGVYHLARLARPRDRALHAAALAHDLGHGPFSHLTEPLMRERLGEDHEARSARLLGEVRAALSPTARRQLAWLDWDEVAQLVVGEGPNGRGALLNGRLDYDNADNIARFLIASGLGTPDYNPQTLASALRLARGAHEDTTSGERERVYLLTEAAQQALAWQRDRARVYTYLHEGHHNLALHAMLRKAVDLGAATNILPSTFFDMTDLQALRLLGDALDRGLTVLTRCVQTGAIYQCVWEAEAPRSPDGIAQLFGSWRARDAVESRLAGEAGLARHEVIVAPLVSSAARALPPLGAPTGPLTLPQPAELLAPPMVLHLFAPAPTGQDYLRRLKMAAERVFGPMGVIVRPLDTHP
ncbi:MAG: hypothetical protein OJF49_000747 [Ktedonobacterales bacterium]|jgi:HD superfamily phosphohydrolase|nr:MAG: hypothetical protein OJF49_000747 [Ktedonobacterales bacterium]